MKAILIDPFRATITEVEHSSDYREIYKYLSDEENGLAVDCFTVVNLNEQRDALYVDDEGLLKDPHKFFVWDGYHQPLAGRGLILGTNDEGDSVSTTLSLEHVRSKVTFVELSVEGFDVSEGEIEKYGKKFHMIRNTPIFGLTKKGKG